MKSLIAAIITTALLFTFSANANNVVCFQRGGATPRGGGYEVTARGEPHFRLTVMVADQLLRESPLKVVQVATVKGLRTDYISEDFTLVVSSKDPSDYQRRNHDRYAMLFNTGSSELGPKVIPMYCDDFKD